MPVFILQTNITFVLYFLYSLYSSFALTTDFCGHRICHCVTQSCLTLSNPRTTAHHASLSFTISWSLLRLVSIESIMPSNHFILCHPLLLLPSIFSSITVFSNESALCIRWPKYCSFSFSISPSSGYSGLISFKISF